MTTSETKSETLPPGLYYIGDLKYYLSEGGDFIFREHSMDEIGVFTNEKGQKWAVFRTMGEDGRYLDNDDHWRRYLDNDGHSYSVDSGMIGAYPINNLYEAPNLGRGVEFPEEVRAGYDEETGIISFGDIHIHTDPFDEVNDPRLEKTYLSLKREGVPAFRRFRVTLRYQLLRVVRWLRRISVPSLLTLFITLSIYDLPEQADGLSEWVVPTILLLLLTGSPLYLANDLFKSDGGDVSDPDDGIGCAIFLVVFIPAWLIVLGLLAYYYLNWIQVITAVLAVPASLIALFIWTTLREDKQARKE